jgi:hypothetical protein
MININDYLLLGNYFFLKDFRKIDESKVKVTEFEEFLVVCF